MASWCMIEEGSLPFLLTTTIRRINLFLEKLLFMDAIGRYLLSHWPHIMSVYDQCKGHRGVDGNKLNKIKTKSHLFIMRGSSFTVISSTSSGSQVPTLVPNMQIKIPSSTKKKTLQKKKEESLKFSNYVCCTQYLCPIPSPNLKWSRPFAADNPSYCASSFRRQQSKTLPPEGRLNTWNLSSVTLPKLSCNHQRAPNSWRTFLKSKAPTTYCGKIRCGQSRQNHQIWGGQIW